MSDFSTLLGHAVSTLLSAGGALATTLRLLTEPLRKRIDALETQALAVVSRLGTLEGTVQRADQVAQRQSGQWVVAGQADERVASIEAQLEGVRGEVERLGAELSSIQAELRRYVTDEEHQAFASQMQDRVHKIAEAIGYLRGRLKAPSR